MQSERHIRGWLERHAALSILVLGAAIGLACFSYYYQEGMTTAHYDAKAHLLVARRVVDSENPGYTHMGINWLPLTHIAYLPFVAFDSQYKTGFLPSLMSVAAFVLSGWLVYRIASRASGSPVAGAFASLLLITNPNLQYLQSCPLTEPLFMLLMLLSLDGLMVWRDSDRAKLPWASAIWAALSALCRYEGCFLIAGVLILLAWDFRSHYRSRRHVVYAMLTYVAAVLIPSIVHFGYIYIRLGDSFFHRVAAGNPAPAETYRRPLLSVIYHLVELYQIAALVPLLAGAAGLFLWISQKESFRRWRPLLLLWIPSIANVAALYWGLIYRVRYSVLLIPAISVFAGLLIGTARASRTTLMLSSSLIMVLPWIAWYVPDEWSYHFVYPGPGILILPLAALSLFLLARAKEHYGLPLLALCLLSMYLPAFAGEDKALLKEAMEHDFIEPQRQEVLRYLDSHYDGARILIDMGRLAPLIYDSGLPLRNFVYNEGQDSLWHKAIRHPESVVGWLCLEKGDLIWEQLQADPLWAHQYAVALQTENFLIYRLNSNNGNDIYPTGRIE
jgi:hypothetical protein